MAMMDLVGVPEYDEIEVIEESEVRAPEHFAVAVLSDDEFVRLIERVAREEKLAA